MTRISIGGEISAIITVLLISIVVILISSFNLNCTKIFVTIIPVKGAKYPLTELSIDTEQKNKTSDQLKVANVMQDNVKDPFKIFSDIASYSKTSDSSHNGMQNVSAVLKENQIRGINTTSVTNNASLSSTHPKIEVSQNPWLLLVQFAVSGAVAGIALYVANRLLDHYRKPCLSLDIENFLEPVHIELTLFRIEIPGFSRELNEFKVGHIVNRVTIRNNGRSAAENCKGILKISGREVPKERYTMTINADSVEYLDVCAILDGDQKEIFAKLIQFVSKFGDANGGAEARQYVKNIYRTFEDIPLQLC